MESCREKTGHLLLPSRLELPIVQQGLKCSYKLAVPVGQLEVGVGEVFSSKVSPTFGVYDVTLLNILCTLGFYRSSLGLLEFRFACENHLMKLCNPPTKTFLGGGMNMCF